MSATDLDNFSQWVYESRKLCSGRDITCLLSFNGQGANKPSTCLMVVNEEKINMTSYLQCTCVQGLARYLPVCRDWQDTYLCAGIGKILTCVQGLAREQLYMYCTGNKIPSQKSNSLQAAAINELNYTGSCGSRKDQRRWKLFLRSIAQKLYWLPREHGGIHLLIPTFMLHNASISTL